MPETSLFPSDYRLTLDPGRIEIRPPTPEFALRLYGWLDHLGLAGAAGFDDKGHHSATILELPASLREYVTSQGDGSVVYGTAYGEEGVVVVRPEDGPVLAHELMHLTGKPFIADEAAAVAFGIHAFGSRRRMLDIIYGNKHAYRDVAPAIALVEEATASDGGYIFGFLRELAARRDKIGYPTLLQLTEAYLRRREAQVAKSGQTSLDHLTDAHGVSRDVAGIALESAGLERVAAAEVYRNNCEILKEQLGAFKALTAFYHVNLGLPLPEAIRRTEEHFRKGEAVQIASTLFDGTQEVVSMLREFNADPRFTRMVLFMMLENGPAWSGLVAKELPALLRVLKIYGRRGTALLQGFVENRAAFFKLVVGHAFSNILEHANNSRIKSIVHPEVWISLLQRLMTFEWSGNLDIGKLYSIHYWDGGFALQFGTLDVDEQAQVMALTIHGRLEKAMDASIRGKYTSSYHDESEFTPALLKAKRDSRETYDEIMNYRGTAPRGIEDRAEVDTELANAPLHTVRALTELPAVVRGGSRSGQAMALRDRSQADEAAREAIVEILKERRVVAPVLDATGAVVAPARARNLFDAIGDWWHKF